MNKQKINELKKNNNFIQFIQGKYTREEFYKLMCVSDNEIPIETVNFQIDKNGIYNSIAAGL